MVALLVFPVACGGETPQGGGEDLKQPGSVKADVVSSRDLSDTRCSGHDGRDSEPDIATVELLDLVNAWEQVAACSDVLVDCQDGASSVGGPDISTLDPTCLVGPQNAACIYETTTLQTGISGLVGRDVHWQLPQGVPPQEGWPAVILFQGSFIPAEHFWSASIDALYGVWYQVLLVATLLDHGFAVITPEAHLEGGTYWDTNIPPYNVFWQSAPDHFFVTDILSHLAQGGFGPINSDQLFAAGISSGGYMTSRMAVSYPGNFLALAIQSASYATCAAATCLVPELPADHPPTLFLHGELDTVVPLFTMQLYADKLDSQGSSVSVLLDPDAGHEWFASGPSAVTDWFVWHHAHARQRP